MLSLHTNNAALSAQNSISRTQTTLSTSMTRLSTGYRINSAMDDAAGLQIATRLKSQTSGMAMAMRNTQNGISLMQTAEGALEETTNILVRMKDLATQAADASSTAPDKAALQAEFDTLSNELGNVLGNTSFGGAKLMSKAATVTEKGAAVTAATIAGAAATAASTLSTGDATAAATAVTTYGTTPTPANAALVISTAATAATSLAASNVAAAASVAALAFSAAAAASTPATDGKLTANLQFQIGASTSETMSVDLSGNLSGMQTSIKAASAEFNTFGASSSAVGTELTAVGGAAAAIDKLQTAIDAVGTVRSALGASANRLDHVYNNLSNISSNTKAAAGRIMDVDFAAESSAMTSSQMLLQAGTAMLKQSNSSSSLVMSLLQ